MSLSTMSSVRVLSMCGVASSSRSFSSSAAVLAGGKGPKKSTIKQAGRKKAAFGGGGKGAKQEQVLMGPIIRGMKLSYSLAGPAPDVSSMTPYGKNVLTAEYVGTPTAIPKRTLQGITPFGLPPRIDKEFEQAGAATVIRKATVDLASTLKNEASSSSQNSRYMLTGDIGSGKSILLLQAVLQAQASDWIVVYAPRAQKWTDSSAPYAYDPESRTFHQPTIAAAFLQSIGTANAAKFREIEIEDPGRTRNLADFIKDAARDEKTAPNSLARVMEVLAGQDKYPVLLAIDEVHALFTKSVYRSPEYELLEAYHLSTPLLALDYLSGRKAFKRGMTLCAYSHSTPNLHFSTSFSYALELPTSAPITPYSEFEPTHLAHASSGFKKFQVPYGMSTKEANGMFQIFAKKGWLRKATDENFIGAFLAAAGNPKELTREWMQDRKVYEQFDTAVVA